MESQPFRNILLLVEPSEEGQHAARVAIDIAVLCRARLTALHIVNRMSINRIMRFADRSATEIEIELEENGWKYLYLVEELSKERGVATLILQKGGAVDAEVVSEAERLEADLIVLAYPPQAHGQVRRLGQGCVEKTVEHAKVPVLVVK